jgi:O-antigen/teichoic acid export membrane protein
MSPARSRFVGNTVSLAASTVVSTVLTLAQMKILAASLPLAIFGLFASLRGLSLLISILAANGFPQALVRFLPEHAARGQRGAAVRASGVALGATLAACLLMLALVAGMRTVFLSDVPAVMLDRSLLLWFSVTTLAVALKLVLYGGFNGLRRFGSQTVLEALTLAAQALWMWLERDSLDLSRLFEIVGVTSAVGAVIAIPWFTIRLVSDVQRGDARHATTSYGRYWAGAVGLSIVAVAFTDVDRWVLSHVLALEVLSLFHVASRIVRLANRFIAVPVLTLQPEITRIRAEGRRDDVELVSRAFFKTSVMMGAFAAAGIAALADPLIVLASGREFLGARSTLLLLAAAIPLTAMTAPLTAVMKALDGVRAAFYCDLAWACVYILLMLVLASSFGLEGTGLAALGASLVQFGIAMRLAEVRPPARVALATLLRAAICAALAFVPVWLLLRLGVPLAVPIVVCVGVPLLFVALARRLRVLDADERDRVRAILSRRGMGPVLDWFVP